MGYFFLEYLILMLNDSEDLVIGLFAILGLVYIAQRYAEVLVCVTLHIGFPVNFNELIWAFGTKNGAGEN